jgi:hypothetical protein
MGIRIVVCIGLFAFVMAVLGIVESYLSLRGTLHKRGTTVDAVEGYWFVTQLEAKPGEFTTFLRECEAEQKDSLQEPASEITQKAADDMLNACSYENIKNVAELGDGASKAFDSLSSEVASQGFQVVLDNLGGNDSKSCKQYFDSLKRMCPATVSDYQRIIGKPNTILTPILRTYHAD